MTNVIGTLLVPFGETVSAAEGAIVAEWDDTMNVAFAGRILNTFISDGKRQFVVLDGNTIRVMSATDIKSQFIPGEEAYLLLHVAPGIRIVEVLATHGRLEELGQETLQRGDEIGFPLADEKHTLSYLPSALPTAEFFGNVGTDIEWIGHEIQYKSGTFPCLARLSYPVQFTRYVLHTPVMTLAKDDTHPILVYVYFEQVSA